MSSFRIRPRFRHFSELQTEEIIHRFRHALGRQEEEFLGTVLPEYLVIRIHPDKQHFWSPQLSLMLEPEENGTLIRGLYGPAPSVWTIWTLGYGALGVLSTFAAIFGFVQVNLGKPAPILWSLVIFAIVGLVLYISAQMGQKLGAGQTFELHHFYENTIGDKTHIR